MPFTRKQLELICFGLYLVATLVGMSMEAIAQIFPGLSFAPLDVLIDRPSAHDRPHDPAREAGFVERRVLAL